MTDAVAEPWRAPLVFGGAALVSAVIVAAVRRVARARAWVDVPNERSSHAHPTPTAGGIGIVVPVLLALVLLPGALPSRAAAACAAAVAAAAAIGLADDLRGLGPMPRLAVHALAGVAIGWSAVSLASPPFGWATGAALAGWTFVTVASINVVNFMDGIDGLIGTIAVVFGLFSAAAMGIGESPAAVALALAGGALGFLIFNRPPASIFMGDVGSGALGAAFIVVGLATVEARAWNVVHAFLPLAPLVLDEALTMMRRLARGENLLHAHRTHVYQLLVAAGWSHGRVTAMYGAASALLGVAALSAPAGSPASLPLAGTLVAGCAVALVLLRRRALDPRARPGAGHPRS